MTTFPVIKKAWTVTILVTPIRDAKPNMEPALTIGPIVFRYKRTAKKFIKQTLTDLYYKYVTYKDGVSIMKYNIVADLHKVKRVYEECVI